jgi:hypothetical protein
MSITTADREGAIRVARARTERQYRGTGTYRVTVGGIVVGEVERFALATSKTAVWWKATDVDGVVVGRGFSRRTDAVEVLAETEFAAKAYREAAREGTFGVPEGRRVRDEDAAALAKIDAQDADQPLTELGAHLRQAGFAAAVQKFDGVYVVTAYAPEGTSLDILRRVAGERGLVPRETAAPAVYALVPETKQEDVTEVELEISTEDVEPGDVITKLGTPQGAWLRARDQVVKGRVGQIYGDSGPRGARLASPTRSTVRFLLVEDYPRLVVRRRKTA